MRFIISDWIIGQVERSRDLFVFFCLVLDCARTDKNLLLLLLKQKPQRQPNKKKEELPSHQSYNSDDGSNNHENVTPFGIQNNCLFKTFQRL
tara:strand:- start:26962 stop:27237 length:276 start_codon:yes stop_codon:yes gene_type:complete